MLEKKKSKKLQESQVKNAGSEAGQDAEMAPANSVQPSGRPPVDLLRVEGNLEVRENMNQIHHV